MPEFYKKLLSQVDMKPNEVPCARHSRCWLHACEGSLELHLCSESEDFRVSNVGIELCRKQASYSCVQLTVSLHGRQKSNTDVHEGLTCLSTSYDFCLPAFLTQKRCDELHLCCDRCSADADVCNSPHVRAGSPVATDLTGPPLTSLSCC